MQELYLLVILESLELGGHGHFSTRVWNKIKQLIFRLKMITDVLAESQDGIHLGYAAVESIAPSTVISDFPKRGKISESSY